MSVRNRRLKLVLQPFVVLALAVVVAVVIGWLAYLGISAAQSTAADSRDGWADLAALAMGMVAGALVGLGAWVVGLVWLSRRLFPRGGRAGAVLRSVVAVAVLGAVLLSTGDVWVGSNVRELAGLLLWLAVLAAPSVVFLLWDRRPAPPPPRAP